MQDETNPNTEAGQSTTESLEAAPVIKHSYYEVGTDVLSKPNALCDILEVEGCPPTTIFCNSPSDADLVEVVLKKRGIAALKLIGHVPPMRTARALKQVKTGEVCCLVVTDVSGQSLDVEELTMVVNYALPTDPEVYIHRCGHSRPGAKLSKVVSLVAALDIANLHYLRKIVEFDIEKAELPAKEQLSAAKLSTIRKQAIEMAEMKDARISELTSLVLADEHKEAIIGLLLRNTLDVLPSLQASTQRSEEGYEERGGRGGDRGDRGGDRGDRGGDWGDRGGRGDRGDRGDRGGRGRDRGGRGRDRGDFKRDFDGGGQGGNRYESSAQYGDEGYGRDNFGNVEGAGGDGGERRGRRGRGGDEGRDRPRRERNFVPPEKHARVYVGTGGDQGITRDKLNEILTQDCKVDAASIKLSNVRSNYSFFDVPEETADTVIDSLNEVHFSGGKLFARRATTVSVPRPQSEHSSSEGFGDEGRQDDESGHGSSDEESMQDGM